MTAFLHPFARPTRTDWISIERGEGAIVWDDQGRRYIDGFASLWYCNIGHGRAEIADAVGRQLRELEAYHCFDRYTNPRAEELCERLASLSPMARSRIFLTNSGSEAVDSAIKLARAAMFQAGQPERTLIVSRTLAYHGVTFGGMSAQGLPANKEGFGPLVQDILQVAHDDLAAVEALFAEEGDRVAAVLAEPVIGAGGIHPPAPGYLEGLRRLCDAYGAFLVLDEVICAFGRLGRWFGAERYDIRPDMITFAKGVSSGYQPLGGVIVGPAVLDALEADPDYLLRHGHTYSGHPACAVAGLVNLDIVEREGLLARAEPIGERLRAGLEGLRDEGLVNEVRGAGAMWAVRVPEHVDTAALVTAMLDRGVIGRALGTDAYGFCPPLVIDDSDLDTCVEALRDALRDFVHAVA